MRAAAALICLGILAWSAPVDAATANSLTLQTLPLGWGIAELRYERLITGPLSLVAIGGYGKGASWSPFAGQSRTHAGGQARWRMGGDFGDGVSLAAEALWMWSSGDGSYGAKGLAIGAKMLAKWTIGPGFVVEAQVGAARVSRRAAPIGGGKDLQAVDWQPAVGLGVGYGW